MAPIPEPPVHAMACWRPHTAALLAHMVPRNLLRILLRHAAGTPRADTETTAMPMPDLCSNKARFGGLPATGATAGKHLRQF